APSSGMASWMRTRGSTAFVEAVANRSDHSRQSRPYSLLVASCRAFCASVNFSEPEKAASAGSSLARRGRTSVAPALSPAAARERGSGRCEGVARLPQTREAPRQRRAGGDAVRLLGAVEAGGGAVPARGLLAAQGALPQADGLVVSALLPQACGHVVVAGG